MAMSMNGAGIGMDGIVRKTKIIPGERPPAPLGLIEGGVGAAMPSIYVQPFGTTICLHTGTVIGVSVSSVPAALSAPVYPKKKRAQ